MIFFCFHYFRSPRLEPSSGPPRVCPTGTTAVRGGFVRVHHRAYHRRDHRRAVWVCQAHPGLPTPGPPPGGVGLSGPPPGLPPPGPLPCGVGLSGPPPGLPPPGPPPCGVGFVGTTTGSCRHRDHRHAGWVCQGHRRVCQRRGDRQTGWVCQDHHRVCHHRGHRHAGWVCQDVPIHDHYANDHHANADSGHRDSRDEDSKDDHPKYVSIIMSPIMRYSSVPGWRVTMISPSAIVVF